MNVITLDHIRLVKGIIEEGTLTVAAEKLHISQPALSHQLKELEDRIGEKVFLRVNKKLIPSPIGQKIYHKSESILSQIELLETEINRSVKGELAKISLATQCYTCYHWLPGVMKEIKGMLNQVELRLEDRATRQVFEYMFQGKIDLAIVSYCKEDKNINYDLLFEDELVALVSSQHPLAKRKRLKLQDIANQDLIVHDVEDKISTVLKTLSENDIPINHMMRVPLTEAIIEMVDANMGISILASWVIHPFLKQKNILAIPIDVPEFKRKWFIANLVEQENRLKKFKDILIQKLKDHQHSLFS